MKGLKQLSFDFECLLPDNPCSVEQAHVTVSDLLSGNYVPPKFSMDYADCENETDDDFDDVCRDTAELDGEFESSIFEGKKVVADKVKQNKDEKEDQDEE